MGLISEYFGIERKEDEEGGGDRLEEGEGEGTGVTEVYKLGATVGLG